ncbi:MAG: hypothetical protein ACPGWR_07170 [Ardenticatenaceae bacterium]
MAKKRFSAMIDSNRVAGIISDQASLDALVAELQAAGYNGEDVIRAHHGQKGIETIDPEAIYHGGRLRFVRGMQRLIGGADEEVINTAQRALEEGKFAVSVLTDGSDAQREEAHRIFKAHGAMDIFFKGTGIIEFLP